MSSRSRRNASRADAARAAAAELHAALAGNKDISVAEEAPVFDKVDEEQYAEIVKKRREEAGAWIVDDDGRGYADIGEEDWGADPQEEAEAAQGNKKKPGAKRKKEEVDPGARARMERMFASAQARKQSRPKRPAAAMDSTDDVLNAILTEQGIASKTPPTAPAHPVRRPALTRPPAALSTTKASSTLLSRASATRATLLAPRPATTAQKATNAPANPVSSHGFARLTSTTPASAVRTRAPTAAAREAEDDRGHHAEGPSTPHASPPPRRPAPAASPTSDASSPSSGPHTPDGASRGSRRPLAPSPGAEPPKSPILGMRSRDQIPVEVGVSPIKQRYRSPPAKRVKAEEERAGERGGVEEDVDMGEGGVAEEAEGAKGDEGERRSRAKRTLLPAGEDEEEKKGAVETDWNSIWGGSGPEAKAVEEWVDDGTLPTVGPGGSVPFFLLDACEEIAQPGTVFLFGKIPARREDDPSAEEPEGGRKFVSCCAVVRDMHRSILVVPKNLGGMEDEIADLEAQAEEDSSCKGALMAALHKAMGPVKGEIRKLMGERGVEKFTMAPVKREYAFENTKIARGSQWVLKVRYPASAGALPVGLTGKTYVALFGGNQSMLEALTVKRGIMGPQWLFLSRPSRVAPSATTSWCRVEVTLPSSKDVDAKDPSLARMAAPPMNVAAINIRTYVNPATHANEVLAMSVMTMSQVPLEGPTADWRVAPKGGFVAATKLDGRPLPPGVEAQAAAAKLPLHVQPSERALLGFVLAKLQMLDVDAFVGHNIAGFDLDVLLHRFTKLKVPMWSRIGRLKRAKVPPLGGGGQAFGGGASPGVLQALAGRLVCDTYLAAREFHMKEVDYTLKTLARSLLGEHKFEATNDAAKQYATAGGIVELLRASVGDCRLALGLMFRLNVLPLTRQIACLTGHLWGRVLQGNRSHRIESLLLHKLHNFGGRKFLLPDKLTAREREALAAKKKKGKKSKGQGEEAEGGGDAAGAEGGPEQAESEAGSEDEAAPAKGGKGARRKPAYAGGYVLEPKKGLYDKYVLLLDFNSLYPSIIQEFNICFTTVERPKRGALAALPAATGEMAPLPAVIQELVKRRRRVKSLLKTERDPVTRHQLDVKQLALKITANSMYGCLGFSSARFYAKPLAELVTAQGREILQSTKDLVEQMVGLDVIYGDTDSIMVYTGSEDMAAVRQMGAEIKKHVNKRYRLLELDLDGVYKRMLLLKKKKYAAILADHMPDGSVKETLEKKGIDIVRRDWCPLAKEAGEKCLMEILSGKPREEVVEAIHALMDKIKTDLDAGAVPLNKFIITKQLTRSPTEYPDAKSQPHVQVALRRLAAGKRGGVAAGETVPYIIAVPVDPETGAPRPEPSTGLAQKARHPEELREKEGTSEPLGIDVHYYLSNQVHPVVSRLCAHIEGTDAGHIAHFLGLESSKFRAAPEETIYSRDDVMLATEGWLEDDGTYARCRALELPVPGETGSKEKFAFLGVHALFQTEEQGSQQAVGPADILRPPAGVDGSAKTHADSGATLCNAVRSHVRRVLQEYYAGVLVSDLEEEAGEVVREPALRQDADHPLGTAARGGRLRGCLKPAMSLRELYLELKSLHRKLDVEGAARKMIKGMSDKEREEEIQKIFAVPDGAEIRNALRDAAGVAEAAMRRCSYHMVNLGSFFGGLMPSAS